MTLAIKEDGGEKWFLITSHQGSQVTGESREAAY